MYFSLTSYKASDGTQAKGNAALIGETNQIKNRSVESVLLRDVDPSKIIQFQRRSCSNGEHKQRLMMVRPATRLAIAGEHQLNPHRPMDLRTANGRVTVTSASPVCLKYRAPIGGSYVRANVLCKAVFLRLLPCH